jgi:cytoskeleton protein RodZ
MEEVVELPGRRLRAAREARGYTVADVAQALKFAPRQIEALEADDYTALPGPTIVRGFVRSYAKYLKLDPVELVALLESKAPLITPDVRPPENMGTAMEAPGTRQVPPLVAASIFLLVVAMIIGGWHFFGSANGGDKAATNGQLSAVADAPAAAVLAPQVRVEQAATEAEPVVADSSAVPVPAVPAALPESGGRQLVFSVAEKSWLEVKDGGQRTIFTGELAAGSRQVLVGQPPFQLVVGNAAHVQLQYEDRQVDLKPHTRAEVARLTLE